ncbi:MAG: Na+/H+ antiporter subunit G [Xanthomonadales bacterium]|nr:Na+/H+ antiporter subunit G [Xanthomonadales bacterium]
MSAIAAWVVVALVVVGAFFVFVGSFGLAKLSEFLKRLHGPTKSSTLGVGCILVASIVHHALLDQGLGLRELLITVFLFITAPISAHLMAKAAMAADPALRPKPPAGRGGATEPAPKRDGEG